MSEPIKKDYLPYDQPAAIEIVEKPKENLSKKLLHVFLRALYIVACVRIATWFFNSASI